jgi:OOP family OmpA-OmpF porin
MRKTVLCALLGAALVPCGSALAQDAAKGFYAGISLGQSKFKDACSSEPEVTVTSCKDNDTAWKLFGGYQFTPNLAVEFGYNDFGKAKGTATFAFANIPAPGTTATGSADVAVEATAWELTGIGSWPLANHFSIYGKLGAYYGEVKAKVNGTITNPPLGAFGGTMKDSNTNLTFGFGARYDFTNNIGLRAEWQRFSKMGGDNTGKADVDVLGVGVLYRF